MRASLSGCIVEQKKLIVALSVLCALLAVLSGVLAFMLHGRSRFLSTNNASPYIMFDTKTAKACWSGPASGDPDPFINGLSKKNNAGLPFCSDLK